MTEIEVAESILKYDGVFCSEIDCCDCPADRIYKEKGLIKCGSLWSYSYDKQKQWFENFLSEVKK